MDGTLMDLVDQLRLYGVEVFWSTFLAVPGVWSAAHRFVVLSVTRDESSLTSLCRQALEEAKSRQEV